MNITLFQRTIRNSNNTLFLLFRAACDDDRMVTIELGSNQRIPSWFEIFIRGQRRKKRNARGRNVEVDLSSLSVLTLEPDEELHIVHPRFRVFDLHFESLSYQIETRNDTSFLSSTIKMRNFVGDAKPVVYFEFEVNHTVSTIQVI